jgi:hypothetical protein
MTPKPVDVFLLLAFGSAMACLGLMIAQEAIK